MFEYLRGDIAAKACTITIDPGPAAYIKALLQRGTMAVAIYRFGRWVRQIRVPVVGHLLKIIYYLFFYLIQMTTGISIQAYTEIGKRFVVQNFTCIFVLAERIGDDFTVSEGVTVGNIRGKSCLPIIGNNVYLEPGCKVLGDVSIGDNVVIRANSLVLSDIPNNSIAIGNPARVMPMPEDCRALRQASP